MNILFKNARLFDDEYNIYTSDVGIKGSLINEIGNISEEVYGRTIDLKGNILIPGFKNAHTHSAMTFFRSWADDMELNDWLYNKIFPAEKKLNGKIVNVFSKIAFLEYISSGITSCCDMYFYTDDFVDAAIEVGMRAVLCDSINDFGGTVEQMERDFDNYNSCNPLISYICGFHAEYTTSYELMYDISKLANRKKSPVFAHISETKAEVEECKKRYGKTPAVVLDELGFFNYGGGGYHCVHFEDEDFDLFKRKNLTAVTCPASNAKLASGIAPLKKFYDMGINVAIGTDGPASNNGLDIFREMYMACVLQNLKYNEPCAKPISILDSAIRVGALALGHTNCDKIAVGKSADLTVIDINRPNMQPIHNIAKNIVYSGSKSNIIYTMINGKLLYEKGEFVNIDTEKIYQEANDLIKIL